MSNVRTESKPSSLFVQLHTLTSYPAALLNRDDVGFAKRIPFGGVTRTRISSQCLKRHWRTFEGDHALGTLREDTALSVRSRLSFEMYVLDPLLKEGVPADLAQAATDAVMTEVLGESAKAKKAKEAASDPATDEGKKAAKKGKKTEEGTTAPSAQTGQITVLGRPELDYFLQEARALAQKAVKADGMKDAAKERFTAEWKKNLLGLKRAAGLDAALFGRMVTSDKLARCDAAIHVAHALTVHEESAEPDYFSAIDDLLRTGGDSDQLGSGHIGTTELTSGLFYTYVVVDVAQLVSNLEGGKASDWAKQDSTLAQDVVRSLVHLIATVSPGAKLGSTAPYAYAHLVLAEVGHSQPRTLANAFLSPVKPRPDLLHNTFEMLASHVAEVDNMYDLTSQRAYAAIGAGKQLANLGANMKLREVADFAAASLVQKV